jgi:hypothetical protein
MKFFKFGKKKEEKEKPSEEIKKPTELEMICGDDKEVYEALLWTMHFNPQKLGVSMQKAAKKAEESEKFGDLMETRKWYHIAGQLALYEGDVAKVKEYFGKCKDLFPEGHYKILEIPEKAIAKAREYYQKHLKPEEKK